MELSKEEIIEKKIPILKTGTSGVYFLIYENEIIYIGSSKSLEQRIFTHTHRKEIIFDHYYQIPCQNYLIEEVKYILKFNPRYNSVISSKLLLQLGFISLKTIKKIAKQTTERCPPWDHQNLSFKIKRNEKSGILCPVDCSFLKLYLIGDILKIVKEFYGETKEIKYQIFLEELEEILNGK